MGSVKWPAGCPPSASCCSEFGYCRPKAEWDAGYFRDCNGVSNGLPLAAEALEAEAAAAAAGDNAAAGILVVPAGGSSAAGGYAAAAPLPVVAPAAPVAAPVAGAAAVAPVAAPAVA